jgi:hypothetical protein
MNYSQVLILIVKIRTPPRNCINVIACECTCCIQNVCVHMLCTKSIIGSNFEATVVLGYTHANALMVVMAKP